MLLESNNSQNKSCAVVKTTNNQLTHFQADYPISYYIFSLHKIIT